MKNSILLLLLCISLFAWTQGTKANTIISNLKMPEKCDTVFVFQQSSNDDIVKDYQQILEKTNNQLSLWMNPYGILVTILGVLFAILTIVATFVIFRQSKEYKGLIQKSLTEHKVALDKLIIEKSEQLKNLEETLDKLILEYKTKLDNTDEKQKNLIELFINKLEEQKILIDGKYNIFEHRGWKPWDIPVNYLIDKSSTFHAKITLKSPNQKFIIYIRVRTNDNKYLWLGFAGSDEDRQYSVKDEFTEYRVYNSDEVQIEENIYSFFKHGFPGSSGEPLLVDLVRLRGSVSDDRKIEFKFKIK